MQNKFSAIMIAIFLSLTFVILPNDTTADINVPSCESLKDFPLSGIAYKKYDPILEKYFGKPLVEWTESDFDIFISTFVSCRENHDNFFKNYSKTYFPQQVKREVNDLKKKAKYESEKIEANKDVNRLGKEVESLAEQAKALAISESGLARLGEIRKEASRLFKKNNYTGDFDKVIDRIDTVLLRYERALQDNKLQDEHAREKAAEEAKEQESLVKQENEAKKLLNKHGKIGPSEDMLSSQFRTYAGSASSGDMGTVIKFYDSLRGKLNWKKQGEAWVLHQKMKDDVEGKNHKIVYGFYDLRSKEGYVWLEAVIVDDQEYPPSELNYYVMQVMR